MSTHNLVHTLHRKTFLVDWDRGEWKAYEASPGLLPCPLSRVADRGFGPLSLIFKDDAAIDKFLDDTDRRFDALQQFVRICRRHRGVVVMTAGELLEIAAMDGGLSGEREGPWKITLAKTKITFPKHWNPLRLLQLSEPAGAWHWIQVVSTPQFAYRFEEALQFADALLGVAFREVPTVAPETRGVTFMDGFRHPQAEGEPDDGGVLVVPDDAWRPMRHIGTGGYRFFEGSFIDEKYRVKAYELRRPLLIDTSGGSKNLADRLLPVDVLAAGVAPA